MTNYNKNKKLPYFLYFVGGWFSKTEKHDSHTNIVDEEIRRWVMLVRRRMQGGQELYRLREARLR